MIYSKIFILNFRIKWKELDNIYDDDTKEQKKGQLQEAQNDQYKELRHFFSNNTDEINAEFQKCCVISELDFRAMMFLLIILDFKMYIPPLFEAMLNNSTATRIKINDIQEDIMNCLDESIGSKMIRILLDYMFVHVPTLDR